MYYGWDFRLQKMVSLIAQFLDMQQRDIGGMGYQALLVVLLYSALNTRRSDPELTCDGRTIDPAWDTMIQPLLDAGADLNYQSNNDNDDENHGCPLLQSLLANKHSRCRFEGGEEQAKRRILNRMIQAGFDPLQSHDVTIPTLASTKLGRGFVDMCIDTKFPILLERFLDLGIISRGDIATTMSRCTDEHRRDRRVQLLRSIVEDDTALCTIISTGKRRHSSTTSSIRKEQKQRSNTQSVSTTPQTARPPSPSPAPSKPPNETSHPRWQCTVHKLDLKKPNALGSYTLQTIMQNKKYCPSCYCYQCMRPAGYECNNWSSAGQRLLRLNHCCFTAARRTKQQADVEANKVAAKKATVAAEAKKATTKANTEGRELRKLKKAAEEAAARAAKKEVKKNAHELRQLKQAEAKATAIAAKKEAAKNTHELRKL